MKPTKPLTTYTLAGLLFIGAQTHDDAVKAAAVNELRNRQRAREAAKDATERNREARAALATELEIVGLRSRDEQERKRANRDLFALAKDRAFDLVEIPQGLPAAETVKAYNNAIHAKAKELYAEAKRASKRGAVLARREKVEAERAEYYAERAALKTQENLVISQKRLLRFPLAGSRVRYVDTTHPDPQVGVLTGYSYRPDICSFIFRIKTADGGEIGRALSSIRPVDHAEVFAEVMSRFADYEKGERLIAERERLHQRVRVFERRIEALGDPIDEYLASDARKHWAAESETKQTL